MAEQITSSNAPGWNAWGKSFAQTRDAFRQTFQQLLARAPFIAQHPELQAEYNARVAEGRKHEDTLTQLNDTYNQVMSALPLLTQAAAVAVLPLPGGPAISAGIQFMDWLGKSVSKAVGLGEVIYDDNGNQLGIAPIVIAVGLGVAVSAVAAIAYFVTDNYKYLARLDSIAKLQAAGYTPEQAAKVVDNQASIQASQAIFGNPLLMIALVAGAALIVPQLMKKGGSHA